MKTSMGRHGGNQGRTNKNEARQQSEAARANTDVDSLRKGREHDEAEGHTSGRTKR